MKPPLVDTHCHLLAGLDDGPATDDDALAMCELAVQEGTARSVPSLIKMSATVTSRPSTFGRRRNGSPVNCASAGSELTVIPCAEVMVWPDLEAAWAEKRLLSIGDSGKYLLIELPHGLFVDLTGLTRRLLAAGVRPILAHPERQPEFVEEVALLEALIEAGCLVQVSSASVTDPPAWLNGDRLKEWFRRGLVHLVASDGHSARCRKPLMAAAYERIVKWAGDEIADHVCGHNDALVVQGMPLNLPPPMPATQRRWWLPWG